uniref:Uncharacterized protein n=1 Tax=Plectus sambesii TaxID=2011161 RepID=A0A914UY46_9BILA
MTGRVVLLRGWSGADSTTEPSGFRDPPCPAPAVCQVRNGDCFATGWTRARPSANKMPLQVVERAVRATRETAIRPVPSRHLPSLTRALDRAPLAAGRRLLFAPVQ